MLDLVLYQAVKILREKVREILQDSFELAGSRKAYTEDVWTACQGGRKGSPGRKKKAAVTDVDQDVILRKEIRTEDWTCHRGHPEGMVNTMTSRKGDGEAALSESLDDGSIGSQQISGPRKSKV